MDSLHIKSLQKGKFRYQIPRYSSEQLAEEGWVLM